MVLLLKSEAAFSYLFDVEIDKSSKLSFGAIFAKFLYK